MAALAGPLAVDAAQVSADKKVHKNKKNRKCSPQTADLCPGQVPTCTAVLATACGGDPACQDLMACCSHFGTCDVGGSLPALSTPKEPEINVGGLCFGSTGAAQGLS